MAKTITEGEDPSSFEKSFENALLMAGLAKEEQIEAAKRDREEEGVPPTQWPSLSRIAVDRQWVSESSAISLLKTFCGYEGQGVPSTVGDYTRVGKSQGRKSRRGPRLPIWLQLTVAAALLMAMVMTLLSYFFLTRQEEQLFDQSVKIGIISLNYFSNQARIHLLEGNELQLNAMISDVETVEGLSYALVIDREGIVRAHSNVDRLGTRYEPLVPTAARQRQGEVTYFSYRQPSGGRMLNLEQPVTFKDNLIGYVHVGVSMDFIETVIRQERETVIVAMLPVMVAGLLVAVMMGLWFTHPIARLVAATQEIRRGNYRHRIQLARNDEFGDLSRAFNRMSDELFRNHLMQRSFGKYVGREVADMIMASPESAWLKSRLCEASVLFADIRGFTAYSEGKDPEKLVEELNDYFEIATRVIIENGGYVDKFIGDAVLGVFGVPVYRSDHRTRAVMAAVEIQRYLNESSRAQGDLMRSVGISVHSGVIVAGNIGSASKMEYTVIGDAVNVASRLNAIAGPGMTIISKAVYEGVQGLTKVEALPAQFIKGRTEPVEAYQVLALR